MKESPLIKNGWSQSEAGWWTHPTLGGICRENNGWYAYPLLGGRRGPFKNSKEAAALKEDAQPKQPFAFVPDAIAKVRHMPTRFSELTKPSVD